MPTDNLNIFSEHTLEERFGARFDGFRMARGS